jgi:DsbC/DsbD-like thiol-disulfide interchange protein
LEASALQIGLVIVCLVASAGLAMPRGGAAAPSAWHTGSEPAKGDRHAKVSLITGVPHVAPGGELVVGVAFDIQPDWHIYWNGRNDSGTAPEVEWSLPAGWTASELRWPAPIRHVAPGDLLDHVYEKDATLLVTLKAPESAKIGSSFKISAKVNYLVCNEACVPESAEVATDIRVEKSAAPIDTINPRVEAAEKRVPKPLGPTSHRVSLSWKGATAEWRAPEAARMEFFPTEDSSQIKDLLRSGASSTNTLRLTLEDSEKPEPLVGVLGLHFKGRPSAWYSVRVARGQALAVPDEKETKQ